MQAEESETEKSPQFLLIVQNISWWFMMSRYGFSPQNCWELDHINTSLRVAKKVTYSFRCFSTGGVHDQIANDNNDRESNSHTCWWLVTIGVGEGWCVLSKRQVNEYRPSSAGQENHFEGCPNPFSVHLFCNSKIFPTNPHGLSYKCLDFQSWSLESNLWLCLESRVSAGFCLENHQCFGWTHQILCNALCRRSFCCRRRGRIRSRRFGFRGYIDPQDTGQHHLVQWPKPSMSFYWSCGLRAFAFAFRSFKCKNIWLQDLGYLLGLLCKVPSNRNTNNFLSFQGHQVLVNLSSSVCAETSLGKKERTNKVRIRQSRIRIQQDSQKEKKWVEWKKRD